jgi:hypothetical protein
MRGRAFLAARGRRLWCMPVGFCVMLVAMVLPSGDLCLEGLLVWNAPAQTLARQNAEFGFGHIEPASMFRGVMPFEPFSEAVRFRSGEGRVERGHAEGLVVLG